MTHRVYYAKYIQESKFYVPVQYNIHNKKIVEEFGIKWDTLGITLVSGEEIEIKSSNTTENDFHRPDNEDDWFRNTKLIKDLDEETGEYEDVRYECYTKKNNRCKVPDGWVLY
jgi:hypothetical protein